MLTYRAGFGVWAYSSARHGFPGWVFEINGFPESTPIIPKVRVSRLTPEAVVRVRPERCGTGGAIAVIVRDRDAVIETGGGTWFRSGGGVLVG